MGVCCPQTDQVIWDWRFSSCKGFWEGSYYNYILLFNYYLFIVFSPIRLHICRTTVSFEAVVIKRNTLVCFVRNNDETGWFLTKSTIMKDYESRTKRAPKLGIAADMSIKTDRHSRPIVNCLIINRLVRINYCIMLPSVIRWIRRLSTCWSIRLAFLPLISGNQRPWLRMEMFTFLVFHWRYWG